MDSSLTDRLAWPERSENAAEFPSLGDLVSAAHVVALPLVTRFRGITVREALLVEGPFGWTEFSPFVEYSDAESTPWLAAAVEFGWQPTLPILRSSIPVNATIPSIDAIQVPTTIALFPGCRTAKVKVAEPAQCLDDDIRRVSAVRDSLGAEGRIRVDANGQWGIDEAERAIHALAPFDLEYVEQPCATVEELIEIRRRVAHLDVQIAADESIRQAADPLAVARVGAADIIVAKTQPLGGSRRALSTITEADLPAVVSSALETSVGIAMGASLAASLPHLPFDCGLGTAALLAADVTAEPLLPVNGVIAVGRPDVDRAALERYSVDKTRREWWVARLARCYARLTPSTQ